MSIIILKTELKNSSIFHSIELKKQIQLQQVQTTEVLATVAVHSLHHGLKTQMTGNDFLLGLYESILQYMVPNISSTDGVKSLAGDGLLLVMRQFP